MVNFILVKPEDGKFRSTGKIYKAVNALKAAKKAFRDNKHIERVYVYNEEEKTVHSFLTSSFFKDKRQPWR